MVPEWLMALLMLPWQFSQQRWPQDHCVLLWPG